MVTAMVGPMGRALCRQKALSPLPCVVLCFVIFPFDSCKTPFAGGDVQGGCCRPSIRLMSATHLAADAKRRAIVKGGGR